jgi:signal peptidase II
MDTEQTQDNSNQPSKSPPQAQRSQTPQADKSNQAGEKIVLPRGSQQLIFWLIVIAGVAADLWTKHTVFAWLADKPMNQHTVIEGFLTMVMRQNNGAAFSILSGKRVLLTVISIIALIFVVGNFYLGNIKSKTLRVALAMFTAGITGNLYDRIFNDGLVRDFIDVVYWPGRHWPAFNVADSLLCTAVGLIIISFFITSFRQLPDEQQTTNTD